MAIKLPENHARLSARCHIRSFPLTGSYEAVIFREGASFTPSRFISLLSCIFLLLPGRFAVVDPFVFGRNPSAALALACRSGRLLSHDGNTVGDKVEVTSAVNSQKLFTKLLAGSGMRRGHEWFAVARARIRTSRSRASCVSCYPPKDNISWSRCRCLDGYNRDALKEEGNPFRPRIFIHLMKDIGCTE